MTRFIATFYSQYGAVQFHKHAKKHKIECRLAPVPRVLSSSCGTCARYTSDNWDIGFVTDDLEAVYEAAKDGYITIFSSE